MANGKADHDQHKNAHQNGQGRDEIAGGRAPARARKPGWQRGSGEGKAGLERGDGHPTGR